MKSCGGTCVPSNDPSYGCGGASCAACTFANAANAACGADGTCKLGPCIGGYADCDGNPANGCETQLDRDPSNCSACGHVCGSANATAKCAGGACAIESCNAGFDDCNKDPADGCETNLETDSSHCGVCARACTAVSTATLKCSAGACVIAACMANTLSCDGDAANGCECSVPHGQVSCSPPAPPVQDAGADADAAGAVDASAGGDASTGVPGCYFAGCDAPYVDCDANRANGCEVDPTTDPNNCGTCGFSCGPQATCVAGRCQPVQIIGGQGNPGQLAIDRDYAYWTNYGAGTIHGSVYSVRKDGANATPIAGGSDTSENGAWGIATSYTSGEIYWTTYTATSHVGSSPKVGGGSTQVQSTTGRLRGALLDGNYLYYADYEASTIVRVDVTQTPITPVTVAQAPTIQRPNTIVADGTSIYVTNEGTATTSSTGTPTSAATSGSVIAFTRASIGGTLALTTYGTGLDRPRGLAVDDMRVYWSNAGSTTTNGSIEAAPKAGGAPVTLAQGLSGPRELAICSAPPSSPTDCADDPYVYVTEFTSGNVDRVRKDGTAPVAPFVIASGQKSPIGIAVDKSYVFWANFGASGVAEGTILRLVKQP
jgi:hypothetical protein